MFLGTTGGAAEPVPSSFFSDPYFNDVAPASEAWPYIGGRGDRLADLGAWKFLTDQIPEDMSPSARIEALRQAALLALGADADGADLFLKARLFVELTQELQAYGAFPVRVDPGTCLPPDDAPLERPAVLPGGAAASWRLGWRETLEQEQLLQMLCDASRAQSRGIVFAATRDLEARWRGLDLRTAPLEREGNDLRTRQDGMSQAKLIAVAKELKNPPDSATVLAWVEEFDTLLGMGAMRHTLRPDWASLASLVAPDSGSANTPIDSIAFCGAWIDPVGVSLDPGRFLDAHLVVSATAIRIVPGAPIPFGDPAMLTPPEVVASRIAVALYAAAWRSAMVESKELLRGTTDPKWRAPDREGNRPSRTLTCWAGNPFDLRTLLVRRVDRLQFLAEFGVGFGQPLAMFREELRERVLHFDSPGRTTEQLLYALARLGIAPFLDRPSSPELEQATFPWLGEEPLARLRAAWPARMRAARAAQIHDFMHEALAGFATVRQMPPPILRQFRLRTAESIAACIEPYLTDEEIIEDRATLANARRNLNDTLHDALRTALVGACDEESAKAPAGRPTADRAAIRVDLLSRRAGALASRLLPGLTVAAATEQVAAFGLDHPCADLDAALLRFGALYDAMTAVFALEAHLAGESFDSPFDRAAARQVGTAPFAEADAWSLAERVRIGALMYRGGKSPGPLADPPADCLPQLVVLPEMVAIPPPDPKALAKRLAAWADAFSLRVSGRDYPAELAATGWRAWDDYIEEEARHRRLDLESREKGFVLRVVFAPDLGYRDLVSKEGVINGAAEAIVWSRLPGDGTDLPDRYVIEQVRSGRTEVRLEIPIPVHPRAPGPLTRAAALAWAMVHLR
jgi:hypothetical protein